MDRIVSISSKGSNGANENEVPSLPNRTSLLRNSNSNSINNNNDVDEEESAVIAAPASANAMMMMMMDDDNATHPAQIPPENKTDNEGGEDDDNDDDDDNSSHYSYEYEDEEDIYTGFIVDHSAAIVTAATTTTTTATTTTTSANTADNNAPATIRDEEETTSVTASAATTAAADVPTSKNETTTSTTATTLAATEANSNNSNNNSNKWRQPSREAVNMSLRAEQETTGGKRRLAQDLYRIMASDTAEAGFSLKPAQEDCMKKWTIKLFQFDSDSNLAKDMKVLGLDHIELEMSFPDQYPFEPPFVRVVRPRFKRQTGFVMNGALCMELLTKEGWNPVNDIESVIVSVRSLLVVGDGRLEAAYNLSEAKYNTLLQAADATAAAASASSSSDNDAKPAPAGNLKQGDEQDDDGDGDTSSPLRKRAKLSADHELKEEQRRLIRGQGGSYTTSEAEAAYTHLSDYHKKKGWDSSGWWARKG